MRVVVLGAAGRTGRLLTAGARARGHRVTAFVHRATPPASPVVEIIRGDVTDHDAVQRAVDGQDAVLCAVGAASPLRRDPSLVAGVAAVVTAMERHDVRRLVYLSFLGVADGRHQLSGLGRRLVAPVMLRNVGLDHEAKEAVIVRSTLDWVIVRPPRLTNGPAEGHRSGEEIASTSAVPHLTRSDLAEFMLDQLESTRYLRRTPAVMH